MTLLDPSPFPSFVTHFFFVCSFVLLTIFSELHDRERTKKCPLRKTMQYGVVSFRFGGVFSSDVKMRRTPRNCIKSYEMFTF